MRGKGVVRNTGQWAELINTDNSSMDKKMSTLWLPAILDEQKMLNSLTEPES